jgi:hypothetical protein
MERQTKEALDWLRQRLEWERWLRDLHGAQAQTETPEPQAPDLAA